MVRNDNAAAETPGQLLYRMRRQKEWSQAELARQAGVTQSTVSDLETEKIGFTLHYVKIFAPVFGIGVATLARTLGIPVRLGLEDPDPTEEALRRETPELFAMLARLQSLGGLERERALRGLIRAGHGIVDNELELRQQYEQRRGQRTPDDAAPPDDATPGEDECEAAE